MIFVCIADRSTGPLPLDEDFIIAVIDDGSPLVQVRLIFFW